MLLTLRVQEPEALELLRFQGEAYVCTLHICKLDDKSLCESEMEKPHLLWM